MVLFRIYVIVDNMDVDTTVHSSSGLNVNRVKFEQWIYKI